MFRTLMSAIIATGFLAPTAAFAGPAAAPTKKAVKSTKHRRCRPPARCKELHDASTGLRRAPKTIVFGEGDLVNGARATGGGSLVRGETRKRFSPLIQVRSSFIPELIKSADEI